MKRDAEGFVERGGKGDTKRRWLNGFKVCSFRACSGCSFWLLAVARSESETFRIQFAQSATKRESKSFQLDWLNIVLHNSHIIALGARKPTEMLVAL